MREVLYNIQKSNFFKEKVTFFSNKASGVDSKNDSFLS